MEATAYEEVEFAAAGRTRSIVLRTGEAVDEGRESTWVTFYKNKKNNKMFSCSMKISLTTPA